MTDDKVLCLNPVREALLKASPDALPGVHFGELRRLVQEQLSQGELERLGSVGWYTTTVKLDLEARREIERVPGSRPQRLVRRVRGD
jgi:hypothetical protein